MSLKCFFSVIRKRLTKCHPWEGSGHFRMVTCNALLLKWSGLRTGTTGSRASQKERLGSSECVSRTSQGERTLAGSAWEFAQRFRALPDFKMVILSLDRVFLLHGKESPQELLKRAKLHPGRLAMGRSARTLQHCLLSPEWSFVLRRSQLPSPQVHWSGSTDFYFYFKKILELLKIFGKICIT